MKMDQIRSLAGKMGLQANGRKKRDLIQAIQNREHNVPCYGTERVAICGEHDCAWIDDCRKEKAAAARTSGKKESAEA